MDKKNPPIVIGVLRTENFLKTFLCALLLACTFTGKAQNPKIKCYFNHQVNTSVSSGTNAISLPTQIVDTLIAYINVVIIQDKSVATSYYNEFNQIWGSTTTTPNAANAKFSPNKVASATNTFTVNGTPIEVYFSPKDATASHLQTAIGTANNELC